MAMHPGEVVPEGSGAAPAGRVRAREGRFFGRPDPGPSTGRSERLARAVFLLAAATAVPVLMWANRDQWFYLDEWDFLVDRTLTLGDILRAHNEHFVALPVIVYRVLYGLVGLHHYWPYQAVAVVTHVAIAGLLWTVMRRTVVHPWIAALLAGSFCYFGPGRENISWGFQITFTGAVAFGLLAVLLVDHDGPWGRRDDGAVVAATAALACSGVGLAMLAAVGLTAGFRNGFRRAAATVAPPVLLYLAWQVTYGVATAPGERTLARFESFVRAHVGSIVDGFGGPLLGSAVLAASVAGLAILASRVPPAGRRRRMAAPVALALAGVGFLLVVAFTRSPHGNPAAPVGRYVHVLTALALPTVGVGLTAVVDRWRPGLLVVAVALVGIGAGNAAAVVPADRAGLGDPARVLAFADAELPPGVPEGYFPPRSEVWLSLRWLSRERAAGRVPDPPDPAYRGHVEVGVSLLPRYGPAGQGCMEVDPHRALPLRTGQVLRVHANPAPVRLNADVGFAGAFVRYVDEPLAGRIFAPGPDGPQVRLEVLADVVVKVYVPPGGRVVEVCDRP